MSKSLKANRIWAQQQEAISILREIDAKDLHANRADVALVAKLFNMKVETVLEMAGKLKQEVVVTEAVVATEAEAAVTGAADAAEKMAAEVDARLANA